LETVLQGREPVDSPVPAATNLSVNRADSSRTSEQVQRGFTRICAWCRRIARHGTANSLEWIADRRSSGDPMRSHGICPDCMQIFE